MTGNDLITDALRQVGQLRTGQTAAPTMVQDCKRQLDYMISEWSTQRWAAKVNERKVNPLVNGTSIYTIGPTGNWVTDSRPPTIDYCTVLQTSGSTTIENPIIMATEQQWAQRVQWKDLATSPASLIYIRYTLPNLTAQVWPVPAATGSATYSIGIYYADQLSAWPANLTTDVALQPGCEEALVKKLAVKIWPMIIISNKTPASVAHFQMIKAEADKAFGNYKALNAENPEMACPTALNDWGGWYNIYGDQVL